MAATKGKIVIISSPSGGGKTSICRKLLTSSQKRKGWQFSVSYTTRRPRPNERNKREYHFVRDSDFERLEKINYFAESARVHIYRYGTPRGPIDRVIKGGGVMILDVDVQGAKSIREAYPDAIAIFIAPPSLAELKRRLKGRGTETAAQRRMRFMTALKELKQFRKYDFDYLVINKDLATAVSQVKAIIESDSCRIEKIGKEQMKKITG